MGETIKDSKARRFFETGAVLNAIGSALITGSLSDGKGAMT
jgi:hypothetical protein